MTVTVGQTTFVRLTVDEKAWRRQKIYKAMTVHNLKFCASVVLVARDGFSCHKTNLSREQASNITEGFEPMPLLRYHCAKGGVIHNFKCDQLFLFKRGMENDLN